MKRLAAAAIPAPPRARPLPSVAPYLFACALAAAWISLGTIHRDQHSDSILNVLISLQRWTYFVWEQDRFGMLVPLLAMPIRHPLANMIFQAFASTFAGIATFFLLARWAFRDPKYPLVGAIGACSLLALTPHYYRFEYLVDTSYGIGLALALWALILIEPSPAGSRTRPLLFAVLLMGLAHWVNSATALFLGPFVVLSGCRGAAGRVDWGSLASRWRPLPSVVRGWPSFRKMGKLRVELLGPPLEILARRLWRLEAVRASALLATGYLIGQSLIIISPYQPTTLSSLPWELWPEGWKGLIAANREALDPPLWIWAMGIEAGIGIFAILKSHHGREAGGIAFSLVVTAAFLWLSLGTRIWIQINAHAFRYLFPSLLLIQTATLGLAVCSSGSALTTDRRSRAGSAAIAAFALLGSSAWSYGFPSVAGVRRDVDQVCGSLTPDLLAARCTFLAGSYWKVWTSVFHVNLVRYERGSGDTFWGLASRAEPTRVLWSDEPVAGWVAGVALGDGRGEVWLRSLAVRRFEVVEIRPTIRVYRPVTASRKRP